MEILPAEYDINMIVQALKEDAMKMVDNKKVESLNFDIPNNSKEPII